MRIWWHNFARSSRRILRRWGLWRRTERILTEGGGRGTWALGRRIEIGASGQGTVYGLPKHPGLVYKQYHRPVHDSGRSFQLLLGRGAAVRAAAPGQVQYAWPQQLFPTEHGIAAYTMNRISEDFSIAIRVPHGAVRKLQATLDQALPRDGHFQPADAVSPEERLELAILLGKALGAMHSNDVVYRDLSFKNVLFARSPSRIAVLDIDSARVLEHPTIAAKDGVDTPDWLDPQTPIGEEPIGFDLDRFKYALLLYRLLVAHSTYAALPESPAEFRLARLDGVHRSQWPRIEELFHRAILERGGRPPVSEWVAALSV